MFPPWESPLLCIHQSNQVIFTSACSLKLTTSSEGFCDRKRCKWCLGLVSVTQSAITSSCSPPVPSVCCGTPQRAPVQVLSSSSDQLPSPCRSRPGAGLTFVVKVRDRSSSRCLSCCSRAYRRCWKFRRAVCRCWTSYFNWSTRLELTERLKSRSPEQHNWQWLDFVFREEDNSLLPLYPSMLSTPPPQMI